MKKCCDTCIHKKVCDYWEKEAHPDDYGTYDGEPCIDYFPTDVAPVVHGEWSIVWVDQGHIDMEKMYKCSVCGGRKYNDYRYCPECGAIMDGGSKNGTVQT